MRIVGDWFLFDDGESRPILRAKLWTAQGTTVAEQFLVDTGADSTAFTAALLQHLALPAEFAPADERLVGIDSVPDQAFDPGAVIAGKYTDWSTLKPLRGQDRMFSITSGSLLSAAIYRANTASCQAVCR